MKNDPQNGQNNQRCNIFILERQYASFFSFFSSNGGQSFFNEHIFLLSKKKDYGISNNHDNVDKMPKIFPKYKIEYRLRFFTFSIFVRIITSKFFSFSNCRR